MVVSLAVYSVGLRVSLSDAPDLSFGKRQPVKRHNPLIVTKSYWTASHFTAYAGNGVMPKI